MNYEEVKNQYEISNIKTHKKFWFVFFGLIFIGIVVVLFIIFSPEKDNENKISNKEIIQGASFEFEENSSKVFKFGGEEHGIKIDFVGFDSAGITIYSDPFMFILELNEAKYLDLDNDRIYDIKVKLIKIENSTATVSIKKLYLTICEENWNCSKWSDCNGKNQTRVCEDLNSCGNSEDKPLELRECFSVQVVKGGNENETDTNTTVNFNVKTNAENTTKSSNITNSNTVLEQSTENTTSSEEISQTNVNDSKENNSYSEEEISTQN